MAQWTRQNEEDYLLSSSAQERGRTEALSEGWPHPTGTSTSTDQVATEDVTSNSIPDEDGGEVAQSSADAAAEGEEAQEDLDFDWDNMDAEMEAYLEEAGACESLECIDVV